MKVGLIELRWCGPEKFRGQKALVQSVVSSTSYAEKDVLAFIRKDETLLVDWGSLAILEHDMEHTGMPRKWVKSRWI